jgi:hypothetical protein
MRPITLFLYSLLGLGLTSLLTLHDLFATLSMKARNSIVVLVLIPEATAVYELLNQYASWLARGFPPGDPYFIFLTKSTGVLLFLMIGLQFLVLRSRE